MTMDYSPCSEREIWPFLKVAISPKPEISLLNDRLDHYPITTPVSYTPRLFHLSSSTGWFRAIEETHIACPEDMSLVPDHFPFIQETVYNAVQPGTHVHILTVSNIRRILF